MNSLIVFIGILFFFFWGYRYYARKLENLWGLDPKRPTPAFSKYDSIDYIPAKNWLVLFGHHFASIAGAGPIIGPVIACILWGWLPALLWVVLGSIFIGGVHDFSALLTSVREGGSSIADIAKVTISARAKVIFSLFVWLALILVIAVFAYLCADTFVKEPKIVLPSLGLIPVAMLVGLLLYQVRLNSALVTIFGLIFLTALIVWGNFLPINLGKYSLQIWLAVLFIYCFFASVLPVNILLQPRDYLSSFLLFFGVGVGVIGLFISRPTLGAPFYVQWKSQEGYLWPALFVTIACGAVSGFHSLISSGTTSKQLPNERYAKRISYGGMLAEGVVAVLAVIAVSSCFTKSTSLAGLLKEKGPIGIFSQGYAGITDAILMGKGGLIAVTILNAFILTTLDTAARVCRYITKELFHLKNRFFSTALILVISALLAFSGKWSKIWPAFGASNQLVAALALLVVSCWLVTKNKTMKYTLPCGIFMLITTVAALLFQAAGFFLHKEFLLFFICLALVILAAIVVSEVVNKIYREGGRKSKVCLRL